jgi:CheY-like chemotaxis protein
VRAGEPPSSVQAAEFSTSADLQGVRALVVDDDRDARQLLKIAFEARGAEVVEASSVETAVTASRHSAFDLLVADIAMPVADGYELLRTLRALQPALPAVAVSAYARPEDRARAEKAGYQAFETKPVEMTRLIESVATVLRGRRAGMP